MTGYGAERRDLGRRLAALRKAAGYTQQQLAVAAGYSRSTVSNAEIGHPDVARVFWARCDQVLKSGGAYALAFDQVRAAERGQPTGTGALAAVPDTGGAAFGRPQHPVFRGGMAEALAGYRDLGWPAADGEDGAELVTGDVLDALELPRAAGMLAASLWLYSQGHADDARRLPALPHPARSMAVITAGDRCFFLAAGGCSPWTGRRPAAGSAAGSGAASAAGSGSGSGGGTSAGRPGDDSAGPVIRWHAGGGRIPAPPSRPPGGDRAAWAHLPSRPVLLASATSLLGLLTTAAASAGSGPTGLTLPGGIRLIPAAGW